MEYLGHIISIEEVATDPIKVEAIKSWPVAKSLKGLGGGGGCFWGFQATTKDLLL